VDFFMRPVPYVITPRDFTPEESKLLDAPVIPNVWSQPLLASLAAMNAMMGFPEESGSEHTDYCYECGRGPYGDS
jgi:hypothetical protein